MHFHIFKAASFALSHLYATHMQEKYSNSDNIIDEEESFIKNAHDESVIFHDSPVFTEENRYKGTLNPVNFIS